MIILVVLAAFFTIKANMFFIQRLIEMCWLLHDYIFFVGCSSYFELTYSLVQFLSRHFKQKVLSTHSFIRQLNELI